MFETTTRAPSLKYYGTPSCLCQKYWTNLIGQVIYISHAGCSISRRGERFTQPQEDVEGMLEPRVPYLNPLDPPKNGWESRISFDISMALDILTYCFSFGEI